MKRKRTPPLPPLSVARRVVGYVRVSTEAQAAEGVSLDAQRAKIQALCSVNDCELVAIETDAGASARTLDRPALQRALLALTEGRADAIAVTKLDRLTRSVTDLGMLVERYFAGGRWSLLSAGDSIDTHTAAGRLVLNVLVSVAQWEREAAGERTRDGLAEVRRAGGTLGRDGLGWTRSDERDGHGRRRVVAVERELATVERIVTLRSSGLSLRAIAAQLAAEGARTKRGGQWAAQTVRAVLESATARERTTW